MFTGTILSIGAIGSYFAITIRSQRQEQIRREEGFKTWLMELVQQSDESPSEEVASDLKTWIDQLSEEENKALVSKLALYCKAVGIKLEWLLGAQPFYEELRHSVHDIVVFYLISVMKGTQVKEEAQLFNVYQAFDKKPKKNAEFGQQLYETLLGDGLIPASEKGPLEITKRKDRKKIIAAIRQSAVDKPVAFQQLLKRVVQERESLTEG